MPTHHLRIPPGLTWSYRVQWLRDGQPVDLTGWEARFLLEGAAGETVLELTPGQGITLDLATATLYLYQELTPDTLRGTGAYHLHLVPPEGGKYALLCGRADHSPCGAGPAQQGGTVVIDRERVVVQSAAVPGPAGSAVAGNIDGGTFN
jgi:hypothetical protein